MSIEYFYNIQILLQKWDRLIVQKNEIEDKLKELEASPPRYVYLNYNLYFIKLYLLHF